jgi:DNA-directed RNA polymerase specialized sigma24 family protein
VCLDGTRPARSGVPLHSHRRLARTLADVTLAPSRNGHRPSPLTEIGNPIAFVQKALADELDSRGAWLPASKREECVSFLNEQLIVVALRFDPYGIAAVTLIRERVKTRVATRAQWVAAHRYVRTRKALSKRGDLDGLEQVGRDLYTQIPALGLPFPDRLPSFSKWAYTLLRKRYTDWLRSSRVDTRYGEAPIVEGLDDFMPDVGTLDAEDVLALVERLDHDRLSPRARGALRRIIVMTAALGLTPSQAAEQLGKTRREISGDLDRLRLELATSA